MMLDEPIPIGQPAPDFSLQATGGKAPLGLGDFRGKAVVLVFYVLDFTGT